MYIEDINKLLNKIILSLGYEDVSVSISLSNRPELCDYQCNDVFKIAKNSGSNPIEVGEKIVKGINEYSGIENYFSSVEFCKPGFINLTLSNCFINKYLYLFNNDIKSTVKLEKECNVVLDYGGPNVAKPLHVGHMRTAIVGESIKRILNFFNTNVISDVHLGDIGLQIGQVIYKIVEDNLSVDNININYLNDVYPKMSALCKENEEVKEKCALITKKLQEKDPLYVDYWKKICEVSVMDIKKNYDFLDVSFDYWYGESDSYDDLEETKEVFSSVIEESQGAKIINVSNEEDKLELPPLLFQKSNGAYLYASSDLATIVQRKRDFNPDKILYVTDLRQSLHFKQVFRAADKVNLFSINNLEHLAYGTVNGEDNKPYKTRSGDTPKLETLFDDAKNIFISKKEENKYLSEDDLNIIVNSILKFADLQNSRDKDYIFDLSKFSEVNGKTGPYILYTYLRIKKMLSEYTVTCDFSDNIYNVYDRNLRLKLLEIGKSLTLAFDERKPSYVADYVYNLCSVANNFYQNNYLNKLDSEQELNDYIFVLTLTNKYVNLLLDLLVIKLPTKM
ncbi:MAG: arginine--tRNA ligase [bacterium]